METSRPRRLDWPAAAALLFLVVGLASPALASASGERALQHATPPRAVRSVLTVTAVHVSYQLTGAQSDTITSTVTQTVRWDLVKIVQRTVLAGGKDVGKDAATRDTITLTGSGDARPGAFNAAGGGTFVHRHREDRRHSGRHGGDDRDDDRNDIKVRGIYVVTGFIDWRPAGGTLDVADGIGRRAEASAGILTLSVRLFPAEGGHRDGVLTVNARLRGETFDIDGGITLAVDGFFFVQDEGAALFHVQQ
jgi:hypothetical protein